MLVLNLPFKALMFLTLMRPSLVLFLVLWLKLVKDFLKVRCRLALLPFLISCLIWLDLVASLPLIKERILVIILLLHFLSLMLGSVLVLMLPLLVWLTPDLRIKKSLLKCNWTIRKRLPRCKMRLKKRLLAFSRRLHARIRKTRSEERFSRNAETDLVCRLLLDPLHTCSTIFPYTTLFRSLMLGSVLVLMLPLLVWLTPDLRIKKSLLKCNWTIRKRLPRCKMRLKKRLLAFSRRLHARIRKTRYMHKMRCLLINRRSLDRKSGSAGMPRPISYAVFCLKKKTNEQPQCHEHAAVLDSERSARHGEVLSVYPAARECREPAGPFVAGTHACRHTALEPRQSI